MVSHEIAVKLKEAGWDKETNLIHIKEMKGDMWGICLNLGELLERFKDKWFYAPSLEELMEELPSNITVIQKLSKMVSVAIMKPDGKTKGYANINPCDAAARLWIELRGKK